MKLENQVLVWRTYEVGKPGPGMEMCSMQGPGFPTSYVLHTRTWFSNFICPPYQDLVFQLHMSSIPGPGFPTSYVLHTRTWFSNFICPPYQDLVFQLHMSSIPGPGFPTSYVLHTRTWMKLENQVLAWRTYEVGKPGPGMEDI
jgi:hypothetical protein